MNKLEEINWFPGHMKKALDHIKERLKTCDGVIEVGDSRAPISSFPSYLDALTKDKARFFILSKADLADKDALLKHVEAYKEKGISAISLNLTDKNSTKILVRKLEQIKTQKDERYMKLGFPIPEKRFLILGIPNVGKSTLINSLVGKKKAPVENRPGKTRAESLIRVSPLVAVIDSPGILEPNYEDKNVIVKLALLGSIKTEILPLIALTDYLLNYLKEHYFDNLKRRYPISFDGTEEEIFLNIAVYRNFLSQNKPDSLRARNTLLREFREGVLGGVSLDE